MKQLRKWLYIMSFMLLFMFAKNTAFADATISYVGIDGAPLTGNPTDASSSADFTNAKAALGSETIIAFLYDTCKSAASPSDITADSTVVVVTQERLGGADKWGTVAGNADAVWFVYDNKLYITKKTGVSGNVTISDTTNGSASASPETSFTGTKSEVYYPTLFYSDLDGTDSGIQEPAVGDEITYAHDDFYAFVDTQEDSYDETLGDRDSIVISGVRVDHHDTGNLKPSSVGWMSYISTITDIYISDDIILSGNMNGLFNANFSNIKETGDVGDMGDSLYTSLKNVYLYCDMSQVTSAAGMFGRCNALENIYVRTGTTKPMPNVRTTAYMFYGDKLLKNGDDSFIDAMGLSDVTGLVSTSYMFGGCETIERPNVHSYKMDNVKWTDGMFFGAKNARLKADGSGEKNDIKSWNLSSVVNASAMFSGGDSDGELNASNPLESMDPGIDALDSYGNVIVGTVDMTNWNMDACQMAYMMFSRNGSEMLGVILDDSYAALIDASGMFLRCDYLQNVQMKSSMPNLKNTTIMFKLAGSQAPIATADLTGATLTALKNADFMFYGSGFQTIDTTGISNLASVESAKGMFGDCSKLSSLGSGALGTVTFASLKDGKMMFINDTALVKVDTSGWTLPVAEDLSFMFQNTPTLSAGVDISGWGITSTLTNMECFADGSAMATYDFSSWVPSGVTNWAFAFANNSVLTQVTPATASNSLYNTETMFGMFANDSALTTVGTIPDPTSTNLFDVGGMFANDISLTSVTIPGLVRANVTNAEYFMKNCSSITSLDINGWNTSGVVFAQGLLDGAEKLETLTTGLGFTASSIRDAGTLLRNNYVLAPASINKVLQGFATSVNLEDAYEMLKNTYKLTSLDLSPVNFANTTDLRRLACMEENSSYTTTNLKTIILPESILTATGVKLKDDDNTSINMFWISGDETTESDDTVTKLFLDGTPGANILAYSFGGDNGDNDNRSFITYNGRTINGNSVGTYILADATDTALMAIDVASSLYVGGTDEATATNAAPLYTWTKNGSSIAGAENNNYETAFSGTFVARATPSFLTGENASKSATFVIGASITGITAEYTGDEVPVGENYSLDDVEVKIIDSDGNEITLTPDDYTVDSQKVTKNGDNEFTVTYKDGDDTYTAKIKVPGYRKIGSITATYTGPSVVVGKEYDPEYVTVMAYYADDTTKKEGVEVTPSSLSSLKVTAAGDNTYTAKYVDPKQDNKEFSAQYTVNGYKTISSIAATYTGDKIKVGNKYNKDDVKVTLYYADGSGSATTKNFTVDSQTVTYEGGNSYTASYRDPFGNVYSAGFSVPGYKDSDSSSSNSSGSNTASSATPSTVTASSVNAPNATYSASAVKKSTSTGVVQTGTTGKAVLYLIAIIALICAIVVAVKLRSGMKK